MNTRIVKRDSGWVAAITVVSQQQYEEGPIDFGSSYENGSFRRVMDSFLTAARQIPSEHLETARCEIRSAAGHEDSHYPYVEISYERPATAAEIDAAEQAEQHATS